MTVPTLDHTTVAAPASRRPVGLVSDLAVCVWIPLFALRAKERRRPGYAARPLAVLDPDDSRRLWQVSPSARHAGVKPGTTISQAIGLCPTLALCEADPVYYDERFARLLHDLSNVSPVVEPGDLGRAYVGVDGLDKLHGNPEQQIEVIKRTVGRHGWRAACRLGWGRGKFTAWVAAMRAKPGDGIIVRDPERAAFLSTQSIVSLPLSSDAQRRLWQLGLKTLGGFTSLPEQAVVAQFGREGRVAWRLAAGMIAEPVVGRETPEPIVTEVGFPAPIADRMMLAHALERLIEQALRHPRRAGWRVLAVRVRAALEYGSSWLAGVTLKDPSANRAHIAAPLLTRLEQSPPTGAVERLAVEFVAFAPGTTEMQIFARDATSTARAGRRRALRAAASEIKTRLKRPMLHRVIEVSPWSHLPERRYALIDFEP